MPDLSPYRERLYRIVFGLAAAYHVGFALGVVFWPEVLFEVFRVPPSLPPVFFLGLAAAVGLFGLAYAHAALRLERARPIIALGLLAKVVPPVAWLFAVMARDWSPRTVTLILFNDVVWWTPFALFLLEGTKAGQRLRAATPYVCAAAHALVVLATIFALARGTETVPAVADRIRYVSQNPFWWRSGWAVCTFAALTLVSFYAWWGARVAPRWGIAAFAVATAALACDVLGQSLFIGWLPEDLESVQRIGSLLSGTAATALYATAGVLLTLTTRSLSGGWTIAAWTLWLSGYCLAASTFAVSVSGMVASTAGMYAIFLPFTALLGRKLRDAGGHQNLAGEPPWLTGGPRAEPSTKIFRGRDPLAPAALGFAIVAAAGLALMAIWSLWPAAEAHVSARWSQLLFPARAEGSITQVAFSADGRLAASGSASGSLLLWDVETGKEVRRFYLPKDIRCLAFSRDGNFLHAMDGRQSVGLWSVATGEPIQQSDGSKKFLGCAMLSEKRRAARERAYNLVPPGTVITEIAFSPDGRWLLFSYDHELRLIDLVTGADRNFGHEKGKAGAVSSNGRLALSIRGKIVHLWGIETGEEMRRLRGHSHDVAAVAFAPDSRLALSGGADWTLRLWDTRTGKEVRRFTADAGPVVSLAFSPDGRRILSGHPEGRLVLWDVASGKRIRSIGRSGRAPGTAPASDTSSLRRHDSVSALAFSSDGRHLLSGGSKGTVRLWDVRQGLEIRRFDLDCGRIPKLAYAPDDRGALAGCEDGAAILLDLETGGEVVNFPHPREVDFVGFSAGGRFVITRDRYGTIRVWNRETGQEQHRFDGEILSADGRRLFTRSDDILRLWDLERGQEIRRFKQQYGRFEALQVSPDGHLAVMIRRDDSVDGDFAIFLSVETGRVVRRFKIQRVKSQVILSAGGRRLLSDSQDDNLYVWDTARGKKAGVMRISPLTFVALSPDGLLVASGDSGGTIVLWDVETGREIRRFGEASR